MLKYWVNFMKLKWLNKIINLRYYVEMPYDNFLDAQKIKMHNVTRKEDMVTFTTNKKGILALNDLNENIKVIDRKQKLIKSLFVIHLPTTISIFLIFVLLIINYFVNYFSFLVRLPLYYIYLLLTIKYLLF